MNPSSSPALRHHVRPRTGTSNVHLPEELVELILSKCPVKSVVRFKSVLKSWQCIISDPRFSKTHRIQRSRLRANENKFIVFGKGEGARARLYVVNLEGEYIHNNSSFIEQPLFYSKGIFPTESVLPYPSPIFNTPLCSCHGLILLSQKCNYQYQRRWTHIQTYGDQKYMLWNPSIRRCSIITGPPSPAPRTWLHYESYYEIPPPRPWLHHDFYYDSTTEDHRIVFSNKFCYTVYSCNKRKWREIEEFPPDLTPECCLLGGVCFCGNHGLPVDGRFYRFVDVYNSEIVCLDTRDGNVHKFRGPDEVDERRAFSLSAESGRLYFTGSVKSGGSHRKWAMEKHGRWVMKIRFSHHGRKLINMENEEVSDLYLPAEKEDHGVFTVPSQSQSGKSRFFPYSENLYMPP